MRNWIGQQSSFNSWEKRMISYRFEEKDTLSKILALDDPKPEFQALLFQDQLSCTRTYQNCHTSKIERSQRNQRQKKKATQIQHSFFLVEVINCREKHLKNSCAQSKYSTRIVKPEI
jgi:hypothetical protein